MHNSGQFGWNILLLLGIQKLIKFINYVAIKCNIDM